MFRSVSGRKLEAFCTKDNIFLVLFHWVKCIIDEGCYNLILPHLNASVVVSDSKPTDLKQEHSHPNLQM